MLKRFDPDAVLFRQGDPSDEVILILSGSADVLRESGDDAILLGTVRAGEFVGEMGVLEGRVRSATVRAAEAVEAELIERQAFLERVSAEPELARKLLLRMSARLRDVEDMLTQLYASHEAARCRPRAGRRRAAGRGAARAHAHGRHLWGQVLHRPRADQDPASAVHGRPPARPARAALGHHARSGDRRGGAAPPLACAFHADPRTATTSWCATSTARSARSSTASRSGATFRSTARPCARARTAWSPAATARRSPSW